MKGNILGFQTHALAADACGTRFLQACTPVRVKVVVASFMQPMAAC
jgi:hypothetical protein